MPLAIIMTWRWYSSWLISSAVRSAPSYSAAIQVSRLFDDLLADEVRALGELVHGQGAFGLGDGLLGQFGE